MRFIIRHLSPIIRSRRRFPFLLVIGFLLCLACILFLINHNRPALNSSSNQHEELRSTKHQHILVNRTSTKTIGIAQKKGLWPLDEKGRSLKTSFTVLDLTGFFGSGASEGAQVRCLSSNTTFTWTRDRNRIEEIDFFLSHDAHGGTDLPFNKIQLNSERQQYSMAFIMESEVHSSTGDAWAKFNFKMTYNLDDSYPEPATYFNTDIYILDLLTPPKVPFEEKEVKADIIWIISNCNAHNAREGFVQQLMNVIKVDSYGSCLNNRQGYQARMVDNIDGYMKYKFVIAIENSNCMDYVTEKLVKAIESGSVPIVAGRNGKPDYRRYLPDHSYINIFDYKSINELADDLERIASNKTLYESYLWYKKHKKKIKELKEFSLDEKIKYLGDVIGSNAAMITHGIIAKEKSENKVCKLIRFVRETSWQDIAAHNGTARAGPDIACLPGRNILAYFNSSSSNHSQTGES